MARCQLWCRWVDLGPSGIRGVVNDALAIYFLDATIASAFVARWCAAQRSRSWMGYIGSATTNRRHGSVRLCTPRCLHLRVGAVRNPCPGVGIALRLVLADSRYHHRQSAAIS